MKLPSWICRLIGHKDYGLKFADWRLTGAVAVCIRCGKGYKQNSWVPDILEQLKEHYKGLTLQ